MPKYAAVSRTSQALNSHYLFTNQVVDIESIIKGLFLVEQSFCLINPNDPNAFNDPKSAYLPNFTNNTFTSAGETPGMRDAWPIVVGRMRLSFWRASMVNDCIEL